MLSIPTQLIWLCSALSLLTAAAPPRSADEEASAQQIEQLHRRNAPSTTTATYVAPQNLSGTPVDIVTELLNTQPNPDPDVINRLVAFDATYISLSFHNPALHQIMPWTGTRYRVGPQAFLDTFTRVHMWWQRGPSDVQAIFADGGNVTAWGSLTFTSTVMNRTVTGPWAAWAQVNEEGLITFFQYMEDTFLTASSFWDQGQKEYTADPYGGSVWL